jgi:hypothetical protein
MRDSFILFVVLALVNLYLFATTNDNQASLVGLTMAVVAAIAVFLRGIATKCGDISRGCRRMWAVSRDRHGDLRCKFCGRVAA